MRILQICRARRFLTGKSQRGALIFTFVTLAIIAGGAAIGKDFVKIAGAQTPQRKIEGNWTARYERSKPNAIQFTFQRRSERGGFNMTGDDLPLDQLQGLSVEAINSAKTEVNFRLVREAGTFVCEGYFSDGRGVGFWTLAPNEKFIAAMRAHGFDNLGDDELLSAAMHDLTVKFVDDLKSAGYDKLTFTELRRARTHEVTPQFIREMKSAGYENLKIEQLVRARNHNIDAAYINEAKALGFERQPIETLIRMRNHDINAAFINEMKSAGFENLTIDNLIRLKNHDISVAFINEIRAEGYAQIPAETVIRLKNHDVDAEFIRRAKSQGYTSASLEELIRLRNRGTLK